MFNSPPVYPELIRMRFRVAHRREEDDRGLERLCIVTRNTLPPDQMLRFVAGPDGQLTPDLKRRLPGRGVWVTLSAEQVEQAIRRKAFPRSLKQPVSVAPDLVQQIESLLLRDAVQALSFVSKAGSVVTGFTKVESAINKGNAVAILHATEAAPDGIRKVGQAIKRRQLAGGRTPRVIDTFDTCDLSLALGGVHVIHAALEASPASTGFLASWGRLDAYRGLPANAAMLPTDQPGDGTPD